MHLFSMPTRRQQQILDFIRRRQRESGITPTTREIQQNFRFASQTAVMNHLRALRLKKKIEMTPGKARSIVIADEPRDVVTIPIYGDIAAGMATPAEQRVEGHVAIDSRSAGMNRHAKMFALRVHGDSMIDAHIVDGDTVIMELREPKTNDIVAALIDGETTLKRLVAEKGKKFLKAENPAYPNLIPLQQLKVQGVMVGLVRKLKK